MGINGQMDTLQAAILLAKLEIFPPEVEARSRIGPAYTEALKDMNQRLLVYLRFIWLWFLVSHQQYQGNMKSHKFYQ